MNKIKVSDFDPVKYLDSEEAIAAYLTEAFKIGELDLIITCIGDVARAKGMANIAEEAGLGRESLYKSLSKDGNPSFATVLTVLSILGVSLMPKSKAIQA
jgi:probable addiction module antidote protein